jgi:hypothetical protein
VTGGCYEEHDHHSVGSGLALRPRMPSRSSGDRVCPRPTPCGPGRGPVRRRRRRLRHRGPDLGSADLADLAVAPTTDRSALRQ